MSLDGSEHIRENVDKSRCIEFPSKYLNLTFECYRSHVFHFSFSHKRAHIRRMLLMIKLVIITIVAISTLAIIISIRLNLLIFSNESEEANENILHDGVRSRCSASFKKLLPPAKIERPLIIVVTPTYPRPTRIPDMIRCFLIPFSSFIA